MNNCSVAHMYPITLSKIYITRFCAASTSPFFWRMKNEEYFKNEDNFI